LGLLKDSPRRTTTVQWPVEVDARLDLLIRLAADRGVVISRAQMLSALVATASVDGADVAGMALRYLGRINEGDLPAAAPPSHQLPEVRHRGRKRTPLA
jgi:hypothetical protein